MNNFSPPLKAPNHVTFTGACDPKQISMMRDFQGRFPGRVEWGILLSAKKAGEPRYPNIEDAQEFFAAGLTIGLNVAAHVCGDLALLANSTKTVDFLQELAKWTGGHLAPVVQVNCDAPDGGRLVHLMLHPAAQAMHFPKAQRVRQVIAQTRGPNFPSDLYDGVNWLFDRSGGRGERPKYWPQHQGKHTLRGFAGGIGPNNLRTTLEQIHYASQGDIGPYWIDMETGVCDGHGLNLSMVAVILNQLEGIFPEWGG